MLVLGVESSCDDSAVALLDLNEGQSVKVLAERVSSQTKLHSAYGGVVPELAAREHLSNLPIILSEVLQEGGINLSQIDLVAVTSGPGLKGCLLIGLEFAKGMSLALSKPIVGVNHIEGHILAPFLTNSKLTMPYLALIVSGGHTEIQVVKNWGDYELFSRTMDDAAGEAFDKSANLLGFTYPGGPQLAALADTISSSRYELPRVALSTRNFSFSGLKTAIALLIQRNSKSISQDEGLRAEVAFCVQQAIVTNLLDKLKLAIHETGIHTVVISGGVAANQLLRVRASQFEKSGVSLFYPELNHSTDNGAMIGFAGWRRFLKDGANDLDLEPTPRWPVEQVLGRAQ